MGVVQAESQIESVARNVAGGESRVAAVLEVCLAAIEVFTEQSQLDTCSQSATEEAEAVGILSHELLVGEKSNLVVHEL